MNRVGRFFQKLGAGWMVLSTVFFAGMGVFVKLGGNHYDFVELVFWRGIFGVIMMGGIGMIRHESLKTPYFRQHMMRSISGMTAMLAYFYAMTRLPLATAVTLNYTSPISMVLLSVFLYREKISKVTALGILIGFVGVLLLLQPSFHSDVWFAVLVGLFSGALGGWAYIQVQQLTQLHEPNWRIVFYLSVILLLVPAVYLTITRSWHPLDWGTFKFLAGMGIFASLAQWSMTKAYGEGNKFVASSLSYLTIVFSFIFGVLILNDILHWQEVIAMLVIVSSGLITNFGKQGHSLRT